MHNNASLQRGAVTRDRSYVSAMISLDTIRIFILHGITFAWAFFALSDRGVKTAVNLLAIAGVSVLGQFFLYWCWLPGLRAKSRALAAYRRERAEALDHSNDSVIGQNGHDPAALERLEVRELRRAVAERVVCDAAGWEWGATGMSGEEPGLSIIRPCFGINPCLRRNYESTFKLTYPKFELLFCVHREDDAAVPLIRELMKKYPKVDARVLVGDAGLSNVNPVVNNLAKGFAAAKYPLLWRLDSRAVTCTADAYCMVDQLRPRFMQLVHQMPTRAHVEEDDMCGHMEQLYFATSHPRNIMLPNVVGTTGMVGVSFVIKRAAWDQIGGCEAMALNSADDSLVGTLCDKLGLASRVACTPCVQNSPSADLDTFIVRLKRWRLLRMKDSSHGRWFVAIELKLEHLYFALLLLSLSPLDFDLLTNWGLLRAVAFTLLTTFTAFGIDAAWNTAVVRHATFVPEWYSPPFSADSIGFAAALLKGVVIGSLVPWEIARASLVASVASATSWTVNGKKVDIEKKSASASDEAKREKTRLIVDLKTFLHYNTTGAAALVMMIGVAVLSLDFQEVYYKA